MDICSPRIQLPEIPVKEDDKPKKIRTPADFGIPSTVYDNSVTPIRSYRMSRCLGQGAFAQCFQSVCPETNTEYAVKVLSGRKYSPNHMRVKLQSEVDIQQGANHPHICRLYHAFQDQHYIYLVLEYCNGGTLAEYLTQRVCTETEARVLTYQLCSAVSYLHHNCVLHRDLKPSNLLIERRPDNTVILKLSDFGLSCRLRNNERRNTMCGTPNYIAPEVLGTEYYRKQKLAPHKLPEKYQMSRKASMYQAIADSLTPEVIRGHSYPADVWSVGTIIYSMFCGRPPFEYHRKEQGQRQPQQHGQSNTHEDTYLKILRGQVDWTGHGKNIPEGARILLQRIFTLNPMDRPTIDDVLRDPWIRSVIEPGIPRSLTTPQAVIAGKPGTEPARVPLATINVNGMPVATRHQAAQRPPQFAPTAVAMPYQQSRVPISVAGGPSPTISDPRIVQPQIELTNANYCVIAQRTSPDQDPGRVNPSFYVSAWVDYSNRWGFGFQLSNGVVGIILASRAQLILSPDRHYVEYYEETQAPDSDATPLRYFIMDIPLALREVYKTLLYFEAYIEKSTNFIISERVRSCHRCTPQPLPRVRYYTHISGANPILSGIHFRLNYGGTQLNFKDHRKVVISAPQQTITFVDTNDNSMAAVAYGLARVNDRSGAFARLHPELYSIFCRAVCVINHRA